MHIQEVLNKIEVVSEQEAVSADIFVASTKTSYINRVKNGGAFIPGTKDGYFCKICNQELVLAPSGQRIEAMGAKPTCLECAAKIVEINENKDKCNG